MTRWAAQRTIMTVGYMEDVSTEELHNIADGLNDRITGQGVLPDYNPKVRGYISVTATLPWHTLFAGRPRS